MASNQQTQHELDEIYGRPSFWWRDGQQRRLKMVADSVHLQDAVIIDIGSGVGTYMNQFGQYSERVFGIDRVPKYARESNKQAGRAVEGCAENLPFKKNSFGISFLHEVIDHVVDDRRVVVEAVRVVRPGGHIVIFAPNKDYFFETHGITIGGRYFRNNIPFLNKLPTKVRDQVGPQARAYTEGQIMNLFDGLDIQIVEITQIYPGFDKLIERFGIPAKLIRAICYLAERTRLRRFGISHFCVVQVNS